MVTIIEQIAKDIKDEQSAQSIDDKGFSSAGSVIEQIAEKQVVEQSAQSTEPTRRKRSSRRSTQPKVSSAGSVIEQIAEKQVVEQSAQSIAPKISSTFSNELLLQQRKQDERLVSNAQLRAEQVIPKISQDKTLNEQPTQINGGEKIISDKTRQELKTVDEVKRDIQPDRVEAFAKRVERLSEKEQRFLGRAERIGDLGSFLTFGSGKPLEDRSFFGKFSEEVVTALLSPVLLPESVILAGGKIAAVIEASTISEARGKIPEELGRAGIETGKFLIKPSTIVVAGIVALPSAAVAFAPKPKVVITGKTKAVTIKTPAGTETIAGTKGKAVIIRGKKTSKPVPFEDISILRSDKPRTFIESKIVRTPEVTETRVGALGESKVKSITDVSGEKTVTSADIQSIDFTKQLPLIEVEAKGVTTISGIGESKSFGKVGEDIFTPKKEVIKVSKPDTKVDFTFVKIGEVTKVKGRARSISETEVSTLDFVETIKEGKQPDFVDLTRGETISKSVTKLEVRPESPVLLDVIQESLSTKLVPKIQPKINLVPSKVSVIEQPKTISVNSVDVVKPIISQEQIVKGVIIEESPILKPTREVSIISDIVTPDTKRKPRQRSSLRIIQEPSQDFKPVQDFKPINDVIIESKPDIAIDTVPVTDVPREFFSVITPRPSIKSRASLFFVPDNKKDKSRIIPKDLFRVEVGRKGRKTFFEEVGLTREQAFEKGFKGVENTPAATFRIFKGEEEVTLGEQETQRRFGGRITKGVSGGFVEKAKFRISSGGELRGITALGIKASKKGGKNRIF